MGIDYYKVMNLPRVATTSEIKARYKTLAKQHHPDREGNVVTMSQINEAYGVLSNPIRRYEYNKSLASEKTYQSSQPVSEFRKQSTRHFDVPTNHKDNSRAVTFSPFRSVSLVAILIIGLAAFAAIELLHQSSPVALNSAPSGNKTQVSHTLVQSPNPQTVAANTVSIPSMPGIIATPMHLESQASIIGLHLLSRVENEFNQGKATAQDCETERQQISQQVSELQQEIHATENLMSHLGNDSSISSTLTRYDQLEKQLSQDRAELSALHSLDAMC